jgi:acyl dehydratase
MAVNWGSEGPYCEDFEVGMKYVSYPSRTLKYEDNLLWLSFSGDYTPLYFDEEFAKKTEYKGVIIHPLLVLQLVVSLAVKDSSMNTVAFLGQEYARLLKPVYPGDTIWVETEVVSKRESKSRPYACVVTWIHRGYNQKNELVAEVKRSNLIYKRENSPWRKYLESVGKV